jgi:succinate dehydrogenase / fumarate reductase membrane anchor subunit
MRLTSLALVPLTIGFVWLVLTVVGKDQGAVRAVLGQPFAAVLLLLFIPTSVYHMMIGMQTIIEDYVHSERIKTLSLFANMFFSAIVGVACIYAILRLSFV